MSTLGLLLRSLAILYLGSHRHRDGADGYLSEDERMQDQDSSDDDSDGGDLGKGPVIDYALEKAAGQHCTLPPAATSYFNALLAAKNQGHPVVICRNAGVTSSPHSETWHRLAPFKQHTHLYPDVQTHAQECVSQLRPV